MEDEGKPRQAPKPRPGPVRHLLRIGVLMAAALVGGVVATAAYHLILERPLRARRPSEPPAVIGRPLPGAAGQRPVDPMQQSLKALRSSLPAGALLQLRTSLKGGVVRVSGEADSLRTVAASARALGNVGGVEAVDTRAVTLATRSHVVVPGDLGATISRRYYGDTCGWRLILEANPTFDPRVMRVGKTLVIPPRER